MGKKGYIFIYGGALALCTSQSLFAQDALTRSIDESLLSSEKAGQLSKDIETSCSVDPALNTATATARSEIRSLTDANVQTAGTSKDFYEKYFTQTEFARNLILQSKADLEARGMDVSFHRQTVTASTALLKDSVVQLNNLDSNREEMIRRIDESQVQIEKIDDELNLRMPSTDPAIVGCAAAVQSLETENNKLKNILNNQFRQGILSSAGEVNRVRLSIATVKVSVESFAPVGNFKPAVIVADPKKAIKGAETGNGFLGGALIRGPGQVGDLR